MSRDTALTFEQVSKVFRHVHGAGGVRAVDGVSLSIEQGRTLAIVGESGSGKSTLARLLMKLERPSEGRIRVTERGVLRDIAEIPAKDYYRRVQMVFQDPYASLNGRKRIWEIVTAALRYLGLKRSRAERRDAAAQALDSVGLAASFLDAYPDRLSGGQRQRVSIARALAAGPQIMVLDEPLSALDVSIQAQIVNLLLDLQRRFGLTYVFISHDLAIVRHIADSVGVMRSGALVELGDALQVIDRPRHPYTRSLVEASFAIRPSASNATEGQSGSAGRVSSSLLGGFA